MAILLKLDENPTQKIVARAPMLPARSQWEAIAVARRTPMQHHIWNEACFFAIYPDRHPIVVTTPGGLGAFARKGLIPTLVLAGSEELAEPSEVLYEDDVSAARMAQGILSRALPVRLGHPPADTPFAKAFLKQAKATGILLTLPTEGSPYIDLDESWYDGLERFSSRRRSDFRRMRRRAESEGRISFEFHRPSLHEVGPLLDKAIEIEARSWKAETGTAVSDNPAQLGFFRRYAELAAADGILRINFIRIGDDVAAAQIAAQCDNSYWLFKIGYDERFARCSPGQLLMLESIERAARDGLETFEFLGKAAPWTEFWTQTVRPRIRLNYYPRNAIGLAALARDAILIGPRLIRKRIATRFAKDSGGDG